MAYLRDLLKNIDIYLLFLLLIFAGVSILAISSTAYDGGFSASRGLKVQLAAYGIGFIILFLMMSFDYKVLEGMTIPLYILSVLFLLSVYLPVIGLEQFGSRAWLNLGPVHLQPAEIVKISFVILFADYLSGHRENLLNLKGFIISGLLVLPFMAIIAGLQNDLGNSIVIFIMAAVMFFVAGADGKLYAKLAGVGVLLMPLSYFLMADHQKKRIDAFLNPNDPLLPGFYQVWHSKIAIGSGGLFGKGLFQGTQKELKFLPVRDSDFIYSVIVEEWGFLGGALLILIYAFFLIRIFLIASKAKDLFGSLIVTGILAMFFFQIFENIGMTMGIMPVTGITLPFISAGGSSIITNMTAVGLVLNVGIRSKVINF